MNTQIAPLGVGYRGALDNHAEAVGGTAMMARPLRETGGAAMRIRRGKHQTDFLILPNATLRDERLSYTARGVLAEILSRPDGWETSADALSERARFHRGAKRGEGRRALRAAFTELEEAGYMRRVVQRGEGGRFSTLMVVYDTPKHRGTANGTSVDGTSVNGTSVSGTSLGSTDDEVPKMKSRASKHPPPLGEGLATVGDCGARAHANEPQEPDLTRAPWEAA